MTLSRLFLIYLSIFVAAILSACQTVPTKVRETTTNLPILKEKEIAITDKTVILDARPFFQYSNGHLPQAIPVRWEDFSRPGALNKAHLDSDVFGLATRLSKMGIGPDTHVVVVGNGLQGMGEEGRVAWSLAYLGVKNVDLVKEDSLQGKRMSGPVGLIQNVPMWKPQVVSDLLVSKKELIDLTKKGGAELGGLTAVLDVRAPAQYLKKSPLKIDPGAINMEWKTFFDERGRPRYQVLRDLQAVGLHPDKRIFVVSDDGVKSAAVTMALRELGFEKAGNLIP